MVGSTAVVGGGLTVRVRGRRVSVSSAEAKLLAVGTGPAKQICMPPPV